MLHPAQLCDTRDTYIMIPLCILLAFNATLVPSFTNKQCKFHLAISLAADHNELSVYSILKTFGAGYKHHDRQDSEFTVRKYQGDFRSKLQYYPSTAAELHYSAGCGRGGGGCHKTYQRLFLIKRTSYKRLLSNTNGGSLHYRRTGHI
jgi:hypothetical protein